MESKENVLYLDEFLTLDNNTSNMSFDSQEICDLLNIHELEEYRLEKFVKKEAGYSGFLASSGGYVDENSIGTSLTNKDRGGEDDIYKPKKVRGFGSSREGYCNVCDVWLRLKTSSYWYHMNYKHGINSRGVKYPEPETRYSECKVEGFCDVCDGWIVLGHRNNRRSIRFGWFRHWQKNHSK